MKHSLLAQRSCLVALGLLLLVSVVPSGTATAQSAERSVSRIFLELDAGVATAVDKQWVNPSLLSFGLSLAQHFPMNGNASLFAGLELGQTFSNGSIAVCYGPRFGVCAPHFPDFSIVGVLLGAELRRGRVSGNLTMSPAYLFSTHDSVTASHFGVQTGIGAAYEIVSHVSLTVKFRRVFPSSYEPYNGAFTNRTIGLRFQ